MNRSRRDFLKAAGVTALGSAGLGLAGWRVASAEEHVAEALAAGTRYAMAIDLPRWSQLDEAQRRQIMDACHREHNVPDLTSERSPLPADEREPRHAVKWIWEEGFENAFPEHFHDRLAESLREAQVPVLCNHCERPPCVRVCPTQATWRREDGIIMMDMHRCIGCRYCIIGCPYGSRSFNFRDPNDGIVEINHGYPTRSRGVVEKCSFCAERLARNEIPACVEAASVVARDRSPLIFGDLSDAESEIRVALRDRFTIQRKPELGTNPHVFYIVEQAG